MTSSNSSTFNADRRDCITENLFNIETQKDVLVEFHRNQCEISFTDESMLSRVGAIFEYPFSKVPASPSLIELR
jgi:hypothetical protein